jgi:ribulose 1,5-bisphosphate synthetase/thiazole synthase
MTQSGQNRRPTVLIVGGGPAGMQAAQVAAQRGFRVKLYERQHELGGQINLLVRVPNRVEFGDAVRNLQHEILRYAQDDREESAHDADPLLVSVGRDTPQHCSVLSRGKRRRRAE